MMKKVKGYASSVFRYSVGMGKCALNPTRDLQTVKVFPSGVVYLVWRDLDGIDTEIVQLYEGGFFAKKWVTDSWVTGLPVQGVYLRPDIYAVIDNTQGYSQLKFLNSIGSVLGYATVDIDGLSNLFGLKQGLQGYFFIVDGSKNYLCKYVGGEVIQYTQWQNGDVVENNANVLLFNPPHLARGVKYYLSA